MSIQKFLDKIKNGRYGADITDAIIGGIKQCYDDASVNHDNANMEVQMARGTHDTLNDRLDNVDEIQAQTNAQLLHVGLQVDQIIRKSTINPFDFGAKGDGISDDTEALQSMFIYAYRNKKSVFITKGEYLISKPILIIVDANELKSAITITGENLENTIITCSKNFNAHLSDGQLSKKSAFIIVNNTFLNDDDTFKNGSGNSHSIYMSNIFIKSDFKNVDYGIYTAAKNASSKYSMIRIRGFIEAGFKNGSDFYLNTLEKIRVDNSKISFDISSSINTSLKLDGCYSVLASDTGYKINAIYTTLINCCADGCTGVCFDFTGMKGTAIGLGSESEYCLNNFIISNRTKVTVVGGLHWGNFDSENYTCINVLGNGHAEFIGVSLAYDKTETGRALSGCLIKQHARSKVSIIDCSFPNYNGVDNYPLDPWQRTKISDGNGSFNSRHRDILNYVGYDTTQDNTKYTNAQAIYFGKGVKDAVLSDGRDVSWYQPFNVGDIFMTKKPYETLSMGNCCVSNGSRIGDAKYYGIPLTVSMSTTELQSFDDTNVRVGTEVFNTTLGKPVWKKTNGVWVTADGTRI